MLVTIYNYYKAINNLAKCKTWVVDVETNGLKVYLGNRIIGIAIKGVGRNTAYYFPFRHEAGANLPIDYMLPLIRMARSRTQIGANYKFDMQMLKVDGFTWPKKIYDVQLAAHLLDENRSNFKLKDMAVEYINPDYAKNEEVLTDLIISRGYCRTSTQAKGLMYKLKASEVEPYACDDVRMTEDLHHFFKPHLEMWELTDIYEQVCEYQIITAKMEHRGFKIDIIRTKAYMQEADEKSAGTLAVIEELAGEPINPNSHKQLRAASGLPATDKETLHAVINHDDKSEYSENRRKWAIAIQNHRGWAKVNSSYYRKYLNMVDKRHNLHPDFNLTGTISGRAACYDGLHSIPHYSDVYKVKDVFIARKGYTLVSCDYSQAEMRIAASYGRQILDSRLSKLRKVIKEFKNAKSLRLLSVREQESYKAAKRLFKKYNIPYDESMDCALLQGRDMHSETAKQASISRFGGKTINFSVLYGIGPETLSEKLLVDVPTADVYLQRYHKANPGLRLLFDAAESSAIRLGFIRLFTGRVRHYPPGVPTRKASSNLIQGGAAETLRLAILDIARNILPRFKNCYMLMQIHDQIMFEIPDKLVKTVVPLLVKAMENSSSFIVPMKVDTKIGKSWGKMTEYNVKQEAA